MPGGCFSPSAANNQHTKEVIPLTTEIVLLDVKSAIENDDEYYIAVWVNGRTSLLVCYCVLSLIFVNYVNGLSWRRHCKQLQHNLMLLFSVLYYYTNNNNDNKRRLNMLHYFCAMLKKPNITLYCNNNNNNENQKQN